MKVWSGDESDWLDFTTVTTLEREGYEFAVKEGVAYDVRGDWVLLGPELVTWDERRGLR